LSGSNQLSKVSAHSTTSPTASPTASPAAAPGGKASSPGSAVNGSPRQRGRLRFAEKPSSFSDRRAAPGSVSRRFSSQRSREAQAA